MSDFPWLPIGFDLGDGAASGRLLSQGTGYQIVADRSGGTALLINPQEMPESPALQRLQARAADVRFGSTRLRVVGFPPQSPGPRRLGDIERQFADLDDPDIADLARCLARLQAESPEASWEEALLLHGEPPEILPTAIGADQSTRRALLIRIMTGGVADETLTAEEVQKLTPRFTLRRIQDLLSLCGPAQPGSQRSDSATARFELAGHPEFARIANEYVVEPARDPARYRALGVKMPNGLLLYGPPGSGKTFAMKKLAAFLAWNTVEATLGSIGSSYMHQTTKQIRRLFEQAEAKRPSLLVMNEIDALAAQRGPTSHDYKVEEVNEFLTLLETAAERGILVGATTNRIESIDSAFLRKGRFDLQVRMGYPDQAQASGMLAALLQERPHVQGLNLDAAAAQLAGSPASDFDWTVNEAARLAARAGKDQIDDICLFEAINRLKAQKP